MTHAGTPVSPETLDQTRAQIDRFRADYLRVRDQVGRVIVGHDEVVDSVLTCLFCNGHVLLEGVPGLGKTLLVRTLSRALQLSFSRVQFTPDLMPADITGTTIVRDVEAPSSAPGAPRSMSRQFVFERGPIFAQILLADEINRATPKTQSALLEAMQERSVTVGGTTHPLPRPFLVLATQNPLEQEGTYPLPEAQLDRFFFKVLVGYSSRKDLAEILARTTGGRGAEVEPVLNEQTILEHQRLVERCAITPSVTDYAVRVVLATHPAPSAESRAAGALTAAPSAGAFATPMTNRYVRVGASPRAAQAMVLGAKCRALLDNRASVAVEDIQWAAKAALRHRIILNFEAAAEGIQPDQIIDNILATAPRVAE
jgi:MoxR-like ATPase